MRSMFSRVYLSLLCALIVVGVGVLVAVDTISQARFKTYARTLVQPPLELIGEGWLRQPDQRRDEWVGLVASLTGVEWTVVPVAEEPEADTQLVDANWRTRTVEIRHRLDGNTQLVGDIGDWSRLVVGTGYLLLNELSRVDASQRQSRLRQRSQTLPFDADPVSMDASELSFLGRRQIAQGQAFVQTKTDPLASNFDNIYVPMGEGNMLRLGPVRQFSWLTPLGLLAGSTGTLMALGLLVLLILYPLHRRLQRLIRAVDAVTDARDSVQVPTQPADELGLMGEHINKMAQRLIGLVERNQELNRAVSHDLKTPLARIRFALELLRPNAQQQETADEIQWAVDDLDGLISELMFYHSIGAEPGAGERLEAQAVPGLAEQVVRACGEPTRVTLVAPPPPPGELALSPAQWRRILNNLLSNALRYGRDRVSISVTWANHECCLQVSDDGDGIPAEVRTQVFEPFVRLDQARNLNKGGHGLGLAICQGIVDSVNGTIEIGESPAGGACLTLRLALQPAPAGTSINAPESV